LNEKRSKARISPEPVTLCSYNSRCRRGDEERASGGVLIGRGYGH